MLNKITSTIFNANVFLTASASVIWLTATGHTLALGGLLLALWGIHAAVIFGSQLTEGLESDRLSIWAGPLGSMRQRRRRPADREEIIEAA